MSPLPTAKCGWSLTGRAAITLCSEVSKQRAGEHRWQTDIETKRIIGELARLLPDSTIAALLNRAGRRSAKGHAWTVARVCAFRSPHEIPRYRDGERRERGEVILNEAAQELGVSTMTALRMIRDKTLPARQACPGAPWVIARADLDALHRACRHWSRAWSANS